MSLYIDAKTPIIHENASENHSTRSHEARTHEIHAQASDHYAATGLQQRDTARRPVYSRRNAVRYRESSPLSSDNNFELLGKEPHVQKYLVARSYRQNSYFATKLHHFSIILTTIMACAVCFYYLHNDKSIVLNQEWPTQHGFRLTDPKRFYTFQATGCESMIGFAALTYHTFPALLILGLPGSGLRLFEPFHRQQGYQESRTRVKLKRKLMFQVCEMVGVLVFLFSFVLFLFFWYMVFRHAAFSCPILSVHVYCFLAFLCFIAIFVELCLFARYREHIKMTLGAFKESDQTGNVRHLFGKTERKTSTSTSTRALIHACRNRIFRATRSGDSAELERAIVYAKERLPDFPSRYYGNVVIYLTFFSLSEKNPMHMAAYNGHVEAMKLLLSYGFDVNAFDKFSRVRFSTGDLFWYFAQFFVSKPVDVEQDQAVSVLKSTLVSPLHCAVTSGQSEAVRWLLQHGADANLVAVSSYRSERVPPIFLADHPEIVRILIEHGANILMVPDPGHMNTVTVLQMAYMRSDRAVEHELEEHGGDVALTPFHAAAALDDVVAVRKFIRDGIDVNCLGEQGYLGMNRRTPLHWAVVNNAKNVVEILLHSNADPNFQDVRGRTPLHWAARLNHAEIISCLLSYDANVNIVDQDAMTPLICAAFGRNVGRELFTDLVNKGANINYALPTTGDTALHIAIRCENKNTALAILASGGMILTLNREGVRPIDCTTSTKFQYEVKQAAGHRDVMISYTHTHIEFAKKLRKSLEDNHVTTWLDLMDPSGIGGGTIWRAEIARGITNAALVVCILAEDYAESDWCLKELALAKQVGTPILAVSTENVTIGEDLQVYLYTRQMIPFEPAIIATKRNILNSRLIEYEYDEFQYAHQFRLLLDGVRDEIEKNRKNVLCRNMRLQQNANNSTIVTMMQNRMPNKVHVDASMGSNQFVFISHGDKHARFVDRLSRALTEKKVLCYVDRYVSNISESGDVADRIHAAKEAILKCSCFVVILSDSTVNCDFLTDQLAFAEDKAKPIFPIILNKIEVGLDKNYTLARTELYHFIMNGLGFKSSLQNLLTGLMTHYIAANSLNDDISEILGKSYATPTLIGNGFTESYSILEEHSILGALSE
ncbi:unnamed protein product [Albugo candida]|uniref:TIR domain-containing protein n=1 Tax=Albugo candida TaxID=65357 RepID=A0A024GD61_9STRA|nr:unnamed protein product [Albugo candida]|eukprot:CCI44628.1 unnamed protein product [Albugo candida]